MSGEGFVDRRSCDVGPPPGIPERRRVRYDGSINLGAVLQALTVAGSVGSAIFSAGAWVQEIRDDLRTAQVARQTDHEQVLQLIKQFKETDPRR